ncbi:hypothetical protein V1478_008091 [Vespula squamosa]|uniref:Uncharacterized protein n=1 Tax=Vespula squamosa TaxID=30214 RepID=A0ABD2AXS3_VESSQ
MKSIPERLPINKRFYGEMEISTQDRTPTSSRERVERCNDPYRKARGSWKPFKGLGRRFYARALASHHEKYLKGADRKSHDFPSLESFLTASNRFNSINAVGQDNALETISTRQAMLKSGKGHSI